MKGRAAWMVKNPLYGTIPEDLVAAKNSLRDRLFRAAEKSMS